MEWSLSRSMRSRRGDLVGFRCLLGAVGRTGTLASEPPLRSVWPLVTWRSYLQLGKPFFAKIPWQERRSFRWGVAAAGARLEVPSQPC